MQRNCKEIAKKFIEMTEEEKAIHRKKDKDRKAKKRRETKEKAQMEKERIEKETAQMEKVRIEKATEQMEKERIEKEMDADVKNEYERIEQLIRNRKVRAERNGKEHLLNNLKAKKGMQRFKDKGRIKKFE